MIGGASRTLGAYVLPGNNYHVYDYALFWGSIRADAARRLAAWRRDDLTAAARFRRGLAASGRLAGSTSAPRRSASPPATPAGASPRPPRPSAGPNSPPTLQRLTAFIARHSHRRPGRRPAAQPGRQRLARAPSRSALLPATSLPLELPILLWDERWSTVAVERTMIEADMSRAKRAEKIDAHAAAHILQARSTRWPICRAER